MIFDPTAYGPVVAEILALDGSGERLMPLAEGTCSSTAARTRLATAKAAELFAGSRSPDAAFSGLWLYFSCLDESHSLSQQIHTVDGSFWHAIMHRQEPDAFNSGYWFAKVGRHPVFPSIAAAAAELGYRTGKDWEPKKFIDFVEHSRQHPASAEAELARKVQRAEWQILFDWCATRKPSEPRA